MSPAFFIMYEFMKEALIEELNLRGRGRISLANSPEESDAVLKPDMREELAPASAEVSLPFEIKPKISVSREVFLRIKLVEPKSGRLIFLSIPPAEMLFPVSPWQTR